MRFKLKMCKSRYLYFNVSLKVLELEQDLTIILKILRLNLKLTSICIFKVALSLFLTVPKELCKT